MTPSERLRYAVRDLHNAEARLADAQDENEVAVMDLHFARFIARATENACPRCGSPAGAYCAVWHDKETDTYAFERDLDPSFRDDGLYPRFSLHALGLCPERTS